MERKNVWGMWGGAALIALGIIFLLGQFLNVNVMRYLWPFFILAAGATFFIGMFAGGRAMGALAVPGSVITTIGLILFFQNLFGLWGTWTYTWALIISGAGVGLMIFGSWSELPDLRRAGRVVFGIGLVFFFVFGLFFELGASLLGMRSPGGVFWPVALILVGLYVLFGRAFFNRVSGPVGRSAVEFSAPQSTPQVAMQPGQAGETNSGSAEEFVASGIRHLAFNALGDITIIQGEREGLEIEASEALRERIRSEVRGDWLHIRYEQDWLDWLNPRFWNISPIRYTLYLCELLSVDAAGLGNVSIPSLTATRLEIKHNGTGNITISSVQADALVIYQSGLGNVDVNGRVDQQDIHLHGAGSYRARGVESRAAVVRLSGLGSAEVSVSESLDANLTGMGSIEYFGSPKVVEHVSGLGSIRRVGG